MSSNISSNIYFLIQNYISSVYVSSTQGLNSIQSKNGHGFYDFERVFYARLCYYFILPSKLPTIEKLRGCKPQKQV